LCGGKSCVLKLGTGGKKKEPRKRKEPKKRAEQKDQKHQKGLVVGELRGGEAKGRLKGKKKNGGGGAGSNLKKRGLKTS